MITRTGLNGLCKALLSADPDICSIILFGSFVYAPSLARDIDLLVTTTSRKDYGIYLSVARTAIMAYLGSEETRWERLSRVLPHRFGERFKKIVEMLHINYSYHGEYPKENVDGEFRRWRELVERFVDDLEKEVEG